MRSLNATAKVSALRIVLTNKFIGLMLVTAPFFYGCSTDNAARGSSSRSTTSPSSSTTTKQKAADKSNPSADSTNDTESSASNRAKNGPGTTSSTAPVTNGGSTPTNNLTPNPQQTGYLPVDQGYPPSSAPTNNPGQVCATINDREYCVQGSAMYCTYNNGAVNCVPRPNNLQCNGSISSMNTLTICNYGGASSCNESNNYSTCKVN
jgi:hypothetical protein